MLTMVVITSSDNDRDKAATAPPAANPIPQASCGTVSLIVRGVSCVLLGSTEAALIGHFTPISRRPAKCAMRIAWVHSGALRAPLRIQGDVMAHFAGRREISHESSLSGPQKHTTHAPDYTALPQRWGARWANNNGQKKIRKLTILY